MNQKKIQSQRGFTLIELAIVTAILGIMVMPLLYLEVKAAERTHGGIYRRDLAESGARVIEWLGKDLRSASAIEKKLGDEALAADRLILSFKDSGPVVYAYDPAERVITRVKHAPGGKAISERTTLARHVEAFAISPVDPDARVLDLRLEFSRQMLKLPVQYSTQGVVARRTP